MLLRGRFNLHFLDTLLILIWFSFAGLALLGLVFTLQPGLQHKLTAESVFVVSAYGFVILSTIRYIQHWQFSPAILLPLSYILCHATTAVLVSSGANIKTTGGWVASIVPACVVAFFLVPLAKVWKRIKPLQRRKRWVPPPPLRTRQQKDPAINNNTT